MKRILFSGLFLFALLPGLLLGAEVTADTTTSHPVVLWQRLAAQLQQAQQTGNPIKCMTPHLLAAEQARRTGGIDAHNGSESGAYPPAVVNPDGISASQNDQALTASVREARAYLTALQQYRAESPIEIANTETYISPSGRFRLEFTRSGSHAVPSADLDGSGIPDYIERAAEYADESYVYLIETLGYRDFLVPGSPYLFRFLNIDAYGYTQSQGETTFIAVHNTFEGFPPNDNPGGSQLGALKVTIAHEMMHAIQYVYNRFYWANFNVSLDWLEMDATMIEELVYDEVNDYYNYIDGSTSVFGNPNGSTPLAYEHVTWSLFYAEEIGLDFLGGCLGGDCRSTVQCSNDRGDADGDAGPGTGFQYGVYPKSQLACGFGHTAPGWIRVSGSRCLSNTAAYLSLCLCRFRADAAAANPRTGCPIRSD